VKNFIIIIFGMILISCGGKNSAFIGKWFLIEGERGNMSSNFEIFKNGTGFVLDNAFTWNVENDLFYISSVYDDSEDFSFFYKISDSRLELTSNNGKKYVYSNKLGGSSDILGTWKHINKIGESFEYVFEKNGTLIVRYQFKERRSNWMSIDETLNLFNEIFIYKYSITGNTLTLTYSVYDPINDNFEDRIFLYEKVE
jgi:hypothetical protein